VGITSPDGSIDNAEWTVDFEAKPWVDEKRLSAAATGLKREIPTGAARAEPELWPLRAEASLHMRIRNRSELSGQGEVIDLVNGFVHSLTVSLSEFDELYAAALSANFNNNLTGHVMVDTGQPARELIPVEIRFADAQGELFSYELGWDDDRTIAVRMINDIESNVRLKSLAVLIRQGDKDVRADVEGLDLPMELAPDCDALFTVRLREQPADEEEFTIIFDAASAEVLPDSKKIKLQICKPLESYHYVRQIDIEIMPGMLDEAIDPDPIERLIVDIKGGNSLKLSIDQPKGSVDVRLPLIDLLGDAEAQNMYTFQQRVYRRLSGETTIPWRKLSVTSLMVPLIE